MEWLSAWKKVVVFHVSSPKNWLLFFISLLTVFLFSKIPFVSAFGVLQFLIYDLVMPFLLYFILLFQMVYGCFPRIAFVQAIERVQSAAGSLWWLGVLKFIWNVCNHLIMGGDYAPEPQLGLMPMFVLLFTWMIIFGLSAYAVPRAIANPKSVHRFSLAGVIGYWNICARKLFQYGIASAATVGVVLFFITFFLSYINIALYTFFPVPIVKRLTEEILGSFAYVLFIQLLASSILCTYFQKGPKANRNIRVDLI